MSGLNRDGSSLSGVKTSEMSSPSSKCSAGWWSCFMRSTLSKSFGTKRFRSRSECFATGDEFASSQIYWLYMNNGIDGIGRRFLLTRSSQHIPGPCGRRVCALTHAGIQCHGWRLPGFGPHL